SDQLHRTRGKVGCTRHRRQYRQAGLSGALSPRREGAGGGLDLPRCRRSQGRSGDGARRAPRVIAVYSPAQPLACTGQALLVSAGQSRPLACNLRIANPICDGSMVQLVFFGQLWVSLATSLARYQLGRNGKTAIGRGSPMQLGMVGGQAEPGMEPR